MVNVQAARRYGIYTPEVVFYTGRGRSRGRAPSLVLKTKGGIIGRANLVVRFFYIFIFPEGYDTGLLGVRDFRISVISN